MRPTTISQFWGIVWGALKQAARARCALHRIPGPAVSATFLAAVFVTSVTPANLVTAQDRPVSWRPQGAANKAVPAGIPSTDSSQASEVSSPDDGQVGSEAEPGEIEYAASQELNRRLQRAKTSAQSAQRNHELVQHEVLDTTEAAYAPPVGGAPADGSDVQTELAALKEQFAEFKAGLSKIKYPTVEVHGVFQADSGWFNQDANSLATVGNIQDGADFRRARMSANGAVTENFNYFFQMDFAFPGRPTFTDVWGELTKVPVLGNVRFGQWKQPFSLEVVSSFRYTTFPERSVLFQAFTPFRHIAIGMYDWAQNERMTWAASVYRPGQDQFGDQIADSGGYAGVGRITGLPWYDEECGGSRYLHLGGAYNYVAPAGRTTRFRTIPEYFIGETAGVTPTGTSGIAVPGNINGVPFFVDTKSFAVNHYHLYGTELLWVEKQFSLQTEFQFMQATRTNGVTAYFPGMYVTGGYFLTGEHRPYLKKAGAIDRIKVLRNLGSHDDCGCGWGAVELAARYSYIDLNSQDIQGGRMNDVTLGLNWYLNSYVKVQLNYIRSLLDNPTLGRSYTDIYGLRGQVDF